MLAFVALFTIFVGLVGLLAAIGECQKRRRASGKLTDNKTASKDSRDQVKDWLAERQLAVPSQKQIITLLNKSFQLFSFQVGCFSTEFCVRSLKKVFYSGLQVIISRLTLSYTCTGTGMERH